MQAIQQQGHPPLFQQNIGGIPAAVGKVFLQLPLAQQISLVSSCQCVHTCLSMASAFH